MSYELKEYLKTINKTKENLMEGEDGADPRLFVPRVAVGGVDPQLVGPLLDL